MVRIDLGIGSHYGPLFKPRDRSLKGSHLRLQFVKRKFMLFHHLILSLEIGGGIKHPRRQVALEAARRRSSSLGHELVPTHRRRAS